MILACTVTGVGQNYMGMSHSRILATLGEPDEIGSNYVIYTDLNEEGDNIYYFNENENCISFQLVRNNSYLNEYKKMLKREFTETSSNKFLKKTKKMSFVAELTLSNDKFQILIHESDCSSQCCIRQTLASN
jgi:hypothetical protein